MKKICVLDCTLRDGGYCNLWEFGEKNIKYLISKLAESNIDIIECGFLTNKYQYNSDFSLYDKINRVENYISNIGNSNFALMVNYGEYDIDDIPTYSGGAINTIRVAFHKKDCNDALEMCNQIKNKGYKVFVQAMVSLSYTTDEFLTLIKKTNKIMPYAFYIVDSFGVMKADDLCRFVNLIDQKLDNKIVVGFHSHNNMQLSFSNAQSFSKFSEKRDIIIDSSIMGMGRGAGNLNSELFTEYLNDKYNKQYNLTPMLQCIDKVINVFYQKNRWGYSLPNYLSAKHNLHPNYARFLDEKKTLSASDIDEIFSLFNDDKKLNYDEEYISKLYLSYMCQNSSANNYEILKNELYGKKVILIAPGQTAEIEKEKVIALANTSVKTISVNHKYDYFDTDYVFMSNKRKALDFVKTNDTTLIITSNVNLELADIKIDYASLLNNNFYVRDNAGLMAIKMLIDCGVKEINLVGFDGYSYNIIENYSKGNESIIHKSSVIDKINIGMNEVLGDYSKKVTIKFLTTSKHLNII